MATTHRKFICTDGENNNNKFWEVTWDDVTGNATIKYGRVGASGVEDTAHFTASSLEKKIQSKLKSRAGKPAYREIEIIASTTVPAKTTTQVAIKEAAMTQLAKSDTALSALIERLVAANKHELYVSSGGQISLNLDTGIVTTAMGVITKDSISKARTLLNDITAYVTTNNLDSEDFAKAINSYLMLVPQKVASKRGWHKTFISNDSALQKQSSMLDQLESSVDMAEAQLKQAINAHEPDAPKLFNADLSLNTCPDKMKEITEYFMKTLNRSHTSSKLRPIRVYNITLDGMKSAFEKDGANMKDIRLLWHGTRVFNILSILKGGMVVPKSGGSIHVTGRMFGDGLYFSNQSTKSLNYAQGYWDGGPKDNNCFMFLCDVAMGDYHVPRNSDSQLHKKGHDSIWAKPGQSGIQNDEMIVFRTSQVNIRYLVEFSDK